MKKCSLLVTLLLLISFSSFAGGIKFLEGKAWKDVLALAKKESKLIFLDAYATWCGPCKYLQSDVFPDDQVGSFFNQHFINVKMDMEKGEGVGLSQTLGITSYPTLLFLNGDGELVHKAIGAMEVNEFLELGAHALDPDKQYYTIKKKIAGGKLDAGLVDEWIHVAGQMEDEDLQDLITRYLAATPEPMTGGKVAEIVMHHAESLTKSQLDLIWKNRVAIQKNIEMSATEFNQSFLEKLTNYARTEALKKESMDFVYFNKLVAAYMPNKAPAETQKAKIYYYSSREQSVKALNELSILLTQKNLAPTALDMAGAVVELVGDIKDTKRAPEFITKVQNFTLRSDEKDQTYYKDLALMMIYFRIENTKKMEEYGNKVKNNPKAPENVKNLAGRLMEKEE